jgi:hypothetical protein
MHLAHDRGAAVGKAVDEIGFPERAVRVERGGDQLVDQGVELGVATRRRDADVPDVETRIEAGHVLPGGEPPVENWPHGALAVAWQLLHALQAEGGVRVERNRTFQHRHATDVQPLHGALVVEERRIHRRQ